jgi:hypothetical protein
VPYLAFFVTPPIAVALPLLAGAGTGSMYSLGLDSLVRQAAPEHLFARTMQSTLLACSRCKHSVSRSQVRLPE